MKIVSLKKEEFDNFASRYKNNNYCQSSNYAEFEKETEGYETHYLGYVDNNGNLFGASLMLYKTLFLGYKYAYSPRGLLIDYTNIQMVRDVTIELKKLLKKQKFIFVKIDPLIVASERDKDGNIIRFNNVVNNILSEFKKLNYEHLGFNLYNESVLPRWYVSARLNNDARIIYNNFSPEIKEKIAYTNSMAFSVSFDNTCNVDRFYDYMKNNNIKKSRKYFECLFNTYRGKVKVFYAYLDTKKYVTNANKFYNAEEEKNRSLADIIQSGDNVKYNIQKAINDKMNSDRILSQYKKDIVSSTKALKAHPEGIICGAALTIEETNGVCILINHEDPNYARNNISTLLTYEIMKFFGKMNYKYINLGSVTGNFNSTSKYYPLLLSKLGFNSSILEYIGEFNIIINPFMYRIYKKREKKKEKKQNQK